MCGKFRMNSTTVVYRVEPSGVTIFVIDEAHLQQGGCNTMMASMHLHTHVQHLTLLCESLSSMCGRLQINANKVDYRVEPS